MSERIISEMIACSDAGQPDMADPIPSDTRGLYTCVPSASKTDRSIPQAEAVHVTVVCRRRLSSDGVAEELRRQGRCIH